MLVLTIAIALGVTSTCRDRRRRAGRVPRLVGGEYTHARRDRLFKRSCGRNDNKLPTVGRPGRPTGVAALIVLYESQSIGS